MTTLKPCPFCGSEDCRVMEDTIKCGHGENLPYAQASCRNCGASSSREDVSFEEQEAIRRPLLEGKTYRSPDWTTVWDKITFAEREKRKEKAAELWNSRA